MSELIVTPSQLEAGWLMYLNKPTIVRRRYQRVVKLEDGNYSVRVPVPEEEFHEDGSLRVG